ncbi:MAG: methylated-DNA--[protein]-cysteine S-methyltransferase [Opitutae bacterium]|nr:methylated-DNA--[protein]-cysteine S-methyltransferase [Opitutae bacterium]
MMHFHDTFATPLGSFSVAVDDTGALVAAAFGDLAALRQRFDAAQLVRDAVRTRAVREQVAEYFAGTRREFTLRLAAAGSPFQQRVWAALGAIPWGETRSYGELARQLGSSARAVGRANATNPVCLIVPCHRVIAADGSLSGYAFGAECKRRLLALEGVVLAI